MGENFAILGVCGEGLYCNFNTSLCEPEGALGDDCQDFGCKNGLFCDEFGKCAPEPAANEPCQVICAGDLVCNDNICVDGAGEGQACPEGIDCAAGLECVCATGAPDAKPSRARLDGSLDSRFTLRGSTQRPPNCAPDPPNAPRPSSMALLVLDLPPEFPPSAAQEFLQAVPDQGVILGDQNPRMCIDGQSLGT